MRHRLVLRVVALAGLAVVCLLFPSVGEHRFWLAAVLLGLTPAPVLLPLVVPARHWMLSQSIFDVVATVALVWFVPDVWGAALVIVVCSPTAASALLGRRAYVGLEVFGLAGIGVAAQVTGAENWAVPLAVAALMIPLVASYVDVFLAQEVAASTRLDDVATSSAAVFWEIDATTGTFIGVSGRVEEVLGFDAEALPQGLPHLMTEADRGRWWQTVLEGGDDQFVFECRVAGGDGREVWLRLNVRRAVIQGRPVLRGIAFDITELVKTHEEVRRRAETDHLTGLPNRFVLVSRLKERLSNDQAFALFVLDLDRFKDINDTLGHQAGDQYLQIMAERLSRAVSSDDLVARMGGDEFAVIVGVRGGTEAVLGRAAELVAVCGIPVAIADIDFAGSASCGVAVAPLHGSTAEDLLRRADLAMYAAKRDRSGVHLFEFSADEKKVSRLRLSGEAEAAMVSGQMRLSFQPKVELESGRIVGAEGLLRWHHPHHPERGVLMPAEFLDIVELSRHRTTLSALVLEQGIDFLARTSNHRDPPSVAVNVSIRDLVDAGFTSSAMSRLAELDIPARRLTLEITERDLMDDRTGFQQAIEVIRQTGVQLSIDDFGTGHSSLLRLHQLPVTELKIDRSFVTALGQDPEAEIIVRSILELGRALGHQVVAEGIEGEHEARVLRSLGCTTGQGYLYSPAVPLEDFLDLLDHSVGVDGSDR